jgi:predicted ATP-dependent endonuclease of OLD family
MKLTSIKLENFKSIKSIEFLVKKYGSSYTTTLVGINESGKSNILEAMSFLNTPSDNFDYNVIHNQKDEKNNPINFCYTLEFEDKQVCQDELKKDIDGSEHLVFEIKNIVKNVYLEQNATKFAEKFSYDIVGLPKGLFIKKQKNTTTDAQAQTIVVQRPVVSNKNDEEGTFKELTLEVFNEFFSVKINSMIKKYEPKVSFWKASEKFLVSDVDLNKFKNDIESNIPLKHIFYIAGINNVEDIKSEISKISNLSLRRGLAGKLGSKATEYVKHIWEHDIIIDIEIAENGMCVVSIRDGGKANEFNYHKMTVRSEGFKQFMSLILSLSVEAKMSKRNNDLILIDEPETHLHPSGIRDLKRELLAIGENNYLFISTHSPFLIDRTNKDRNIIIRKNKLASTEKVEIDNNTDIIDDEVLREAFGIEVYKDLLNPHSILVEGASDKKILQKAFNIKGITTYGITNGHGSNIDTLASKLNDTGVSILVVLDDDSDGKTYRKNIRKIGGSYTKNNVVTIRDLVGEITDNGTIEDTLGKGYIESKAKEIYGIFFPKEEYALFLDENQPILEQIKENLYKVKKNKKLIDNFIDELKIKASDDFNPNKSSLKADFPLLESLTDAIVNKLS